MDLGIGSGAVGDYYSLGYFTGEYSVCFRAGEFNPGDFQSKVPGDEFIGLGAVHSKSLALTLSRFFLGIVMNIQSIILPCVLKGNESDGYDM